MEKYCLVEYIVCFNVIFLKCKERQDEKEGELFEDNYDLDNVMIFMKLMRVILIILMKFIL